MEDSAETLVRASLRIMHNRYVVVNIQLDMVRSSNASLLRYSGPCL